MAENIYLAARFEGYPLKRLAGVFVSNEFGKPLTGRAVTWNLTRGSVTGYELTGKLEEVTTFFDLLRKPIGKESYDLLNERLVRGVTDLLAVPGYCLYNPKDETEEWYVDTASEFKPVQSGGGENGYLIMVAPLVKGDK